jgi:hypothetical protein
MTIATKTKVGLDQLRSREAELAEQVEATRSRLSEYSTLIAEARREAVYAGKARPGGELGGSVRTLTDKERKDATALIGLEGDLSATRSVIAEEAARLAEEATAEAREQLKQLNAREETVWQRAGELFGELAATWNDYIAVAEESDKRSGESGIGAGVLAVEPAPLSFRSFLLLLPTTTRGRPERRRLKCDEGLTSTIASSISSPRWEASSTSCNSAGVCRRLREYDEVGRLPNA